MPLPKNYVLLVIITGKTSAKVISLLDGTDYTGKTVGVHFGDQVSWLVQVSLPSGEKTTPPYELDFGSSGFFGRSLVEVHDGGVSPSLVVLQHQGKVEYTLSVPSIGFFLDPDIQSGLDSVIVTELVDSLIAPDVAITWDTGANRISYTVSGVQGYAANIPVSYQQSIAFIATAGAGFSVQLFPNPNTVYATPFDQNPSIPDFLTPDPTKPLAIYDVVQDNVASDNCSLFGFQCLITTPPLKSAITYMQLVPCPAPAQ